MSLLARAHQSAIVPCKRWPKMMIGLSRSGLQSLIGSCFTLSACVYVESVLAKTFCCSSTLSRFDLARSTLLDLNLAVSKQDACKWPAFVCSTVLYTSYCSMLRQSMRLSLYP